MTAAVFDIRHHKTETATKKVKRFLESVQRLERVVEKVPPFYIRFPFGFIVAVAKTPR